MFSSAARNRIAALALLSLPLPLAAGEASLPAGSNSPSPAVAANWQQLQFAGENLAGSVVTRLTVSAASPSELGNQPYRELQDTPEAFDSDRPLRLDVEGTVRSFLGSSSTRASVWFDAASGQVLLRERTRPGPNGTSKIHRFGARGASRLRLEPDDSSEAELSTAHWTRRERKFHHYDMQRGDCSRIIVPALLLYLIGSPPQETGYCVFHDDALYRVRLEPAGSSVHTVDYTLHSSGRLHQVSGQRRLEKIALHVEPLGRRADVNDFELLELRGELAIHLDPETRIPVLVSGSRTGLGDVTLQLIDTTSAGTAGR